MDNRSEEEEGLIDLAIPAIEKIQDYAESDDPVKNLIALNGLVFVFILGFTISSWLTNSDTIFEIEFFALLIFSLIISTILSRLYFPVFEVVSSFNSNDVNGLRLAVVLEFIALTLALSGLLFNKQDLINAAFLLLFIQMFAPLAGPAVAFLDTPPAMESGKTGIWTALGRISSLLTIGTLVIDFLLFIFKYS